MVKLFGAVLLMGCGLGLGLGAAGELSRRAADLDAWRAALSLLMGELSFRLPAMPELLETLSRRAEDPARAVFQGLGESLSRLGEAPFETLWDEALRAHPGALTEDDAALLSRLGRVLGRYAVDDQRAAVAAVQEALTERAAQARADRREKGRAYGVTGLALGAFVVILLI